MYSKTLLKSIPSHALRYSSKPASIPNGGLQSDLFGYSEQEGKTTQLLNTIDKINKKYSRGAIKLASEGVEKAWVMRRSFKSPNYVGDWKELPQVK